MTAGLAPVPEGPLGLMRLVLRFNLHPEAGLHPSWLPPDWPANARARLARLAPEAQAALRDTLARLGVLADEPDYAFDSPVKRLLLLDACSLRRLAFYTSLCAHAPHQRLAAAVAVVDLLIHSYFADADRQPQVDHRRCGGQAQHRRKQHGFSSPFP